MKKSLLIVFLLAIFGNLFAQEVKYTAEDYAQMSIASIRAKDYNMALIMADAAIKKCKEETNCSISSFYVIRANIYNALKEYDRAISDYNIALENIAEEEYENKLDILIWRASIYYYMNNYGKFQSEMYETLNTCNSYIKKFPNNKKLQFDRIKIYTRLGQNQNAIDEVFSIIEKNPSQPLEVFDAYESTLLLDIKYSQKMVEKKLKKSPNEINWLYIQATLTFYSNNYPLALQQFDRIIYTFGSDYRLLHAKFVCYYSEKCAEKALAMLDKIENIHNKLDDDDLYYKRTIYGWLNDYENQIKVCTDLLERRGFKASVLYTRASAYIKLGDDAKAIIDLNTIIENESTYLLAYYKRAELHEKYNSHELAKANYEEILKADTKCNSSSIRHYALLELGKEKEAEEWINNIVATAPNNAGVRYDQACLLAQIGKTKEALASLSKALELGYNSFNHMMNDTDLENVRQLPEFIPLVEKYKKVQDNKCSQLVEP